MGMVLCATRSSLVFHMEADLHFHATRTVPYKSQSFLNYQEIAKTSPCLYTNSFTLLSTQLSDTLKISYIVSHEGPNP